MFSRIRKRFTYTNVAMTLALVFAMTGGAYAAKHYVITSTKQISPKVLTALKGSTGSAGPAGPAGPAGAKGETGAAGGPGKEGQPGQEGKEGQPGKEGPKGATGPTGQTGYTATLPSKATETGTWSISGTESTSHPLVTSISFAIPLAKELDAHHVIFVGLEELIAKKTPEACPGEYNEADVEGVEPKAEPGYLCVYEGLVHGMETEGSVATRNEKAIVAIGLPVLGSVGELGAGKVGAQLSFKEKLGSGGTGASGTGVWVVTAE